ncbi:MAG: 30S ribosomal protein S18 [Elusimicrobia bacterium]|nr:30S ribosomal protein S18 [Elusimicrobiota bacterium]
MPSATPTAAPAPAAVAPSHSAGAGPKRRGAFAPRRKVCRFCAEQIRDVDWKQFQLLRTFTTERGKILSSRVTGTCATHQRQLSRAIMRARHLALLPFVSN